MSAQPSHLFCFFFYAAATTEIYTLSLHDALPISEITSLLTRPGIIAVVRTDKPAQVPAVCEALLAGGVIAHEITRSEEHTSELQSLTNLVCRLLLEKKKRAA